MLLVRHVGVSRLGDALRQASWRWLGAATVANVLIIPLAAAQWLALLPSEVKVAPRRMLRVMSLTSFANNTTPSLVGHATGMLLLAAEPTASAPIAMSVLALDQVCVGVAKAAVIALAAAASPMPTWMRDGSFGLLAGVAILLGSAIGAAIWGKKWIARGAGATLRIYNAVIRWATSMSVLLDVRRSGPALGMALLVKVAEGIGIACAQRAFGVPVSLGSVGLVLAATALSSVVPVAPANIGTYEAATYTAYRTLGIDPQSALSIAITQHACLLVAMVLPGYVVLLVGRNSRLPRQ